MKKIARTVLMLAAAGLLAACEDVTVTGPDAVPGIRVEPFSIPVIPAGVSATQTRAVSGIASVSISGIGTLYVDQTGTESLTVSAEGRVLPDLLSEVRGGRLTLGTRPGADLSTSVPIVYRLTVRELNEIHVSGVVRVEATGLAARRLVVRVEGLSELLAAGTVDVQSAMVAGMSRYEADGLASRHADVRVSGTARALVRASERLSGWVRDSGRVEYLGDPVVAVDVSGSGSLRRLGS